MTTQDPHAGFGPTDSVFVPPQDTAVSEGPSQFAAEPASVGFGAPAPSLAAETQPHAGDFASQIEHADDTVGQVDQMTPLPVPGLAPLPAQPVAPQPVAPQPVAPQPVAPQPVAQAAPVVAEHAPFMRPDTQATPAPTFGQLDPTATAQPTEPTPPLYGHVPPVPADPTPAASPTASGGPFATTDHVTFGQLDPTATPTTGRRRKPNHGKKALAGLATAAVLGATLAGGFAFAQFFSGGGTQPEDVLPANTLAFAKVNFDPSAAQKINALRLLDKVPNLGTGDDLKQRILEDVFTDENFTYTEDYAPWLGDRAAVAIVPAANPDDTDGTTEIVAVQVTDEQKATATLTAMAAAQKTDADRMADATAGIDPGTLGTNRDGTPTDGAPGLPEPSVLAYTFTNGYAVIAENQTELDALNLDTTLATRDGFADQMAAAHADDQIILGWADITAAYTALPEQDRADLADIYNGATPSGTATLGVHATPDYLEVTGDITGAPTDLTGTLGTTPGTGLLTSLPGDHVLAAAAINDLGPFLADLWTKHANPQIRQDAEAAAADLGLDLTLPDDFTALFGTQMALAATDPTGNLSGTDTTGYLRVITPNPDRANELLTPLLAMAKQHQNTDPTAREIADLTVKTLPDGYALTTRPQDMAALLNPTGPTLGEDPQFTKVVADPENASLAFYLDLDPVVAALSSLGDTRADQDDSGDDQMLTALDAFGVSVVPTDDGGTFTARLALK